MRSPPLWRVLAVPPPEEGTLGRRNGGHQLPLARISRNGFRDLGGSGFRRFFGRFGSVRSLRSPSKSCRQFCVSDALPDSAPTSKCNRLRCPDSAPKVNVTGCAPSVLLPKVHVTGSALIGLSSSRRSRHCKRRHLSLHQHTHPLEV